MPQVRADSMAAAPKYKTDEKVIFDFDGVRKEGIIFGVHAEDGPTYDIVTQHPRMGYNVPEDLIVRSARADVASGPQASEIPISNRYLWQALTGESTTDTVADLLRTSRERLQLGVLYYDAPKYGISLSRGISEYFLFLEDLECTGCWSE